MATSACWFSTDESTPSTMPKLWQQCLTVDKLAQLSLLDKNILTRACVGYMLRIYKFTDIVKLLSRTKITVPEIRDLRHVLTDDFRAVLGLKMIIIRCLAREMQQQPRRLKREIALTNSHILKSNTNDLLLTESDAAIYHNLSAMHLKKLLMLRLPELPGEHIPMVGQIIQQCHATMIELEGFITRFAKRKHRFIITSNNMQLHDIIYELYFKATSAFYLYTPWQSAEHRKNSVKRAIHNHGMALIVHYNRPENKRLRFNPYINKYENLIVTDALPMQQLVAKNSVSDVEAIEDESGTLHINRSIGLANFARLDNNMIIHDYIKKQNSELATKVLELLTMEDDDEFIEFVKNKTNNQELTSNELIYNNIGRRKYLVMIARFLQVPKASVKTVVSDVRELLSHGI